METNQVLDITKPIRKKGTNTTLVYVGHTPNRRIVCSTVDGALLFTGAPGDFENIPGPKRTVSRNIRLTTDIDELWMDLFVITTCRLTYTEGE